MQSQLRRSSYKRLRAAGAIARLEEGMMAVLAHLDSQTRPPDFASPPAYQTVRPNMHTSPPMAPHHVFPPSRPPFTPVPFHLTTPQFTQHQMGANPTTENVTVNTPAVTVSSQVQLQCIPPAPLLEPHHLLANHFHNENQVAQMMPIKWKFDFPKFNGENPYEWIQKCEDFFFFHNTPEHLKVYSAGFNIEGEAGKWLRYQRAERLIHAWGDLCTLILGRFDSEGKRVGRLSRFDS
ncbi:hypothetical protein ZOSMA_111G00310 [Zostera marina]|uniref:Retrotransposon gag domain-containing protein n=1 Tax=Zostera marina TaxID=29655 RepID=A0A0K9Q5G1_ZOSMR|nr:hypothetical protein ZOSMA_111G00310 [Zostera marina]